MNGEILHIVNKFMGFMTSLSDTKPKKCFLMYKLFNYVSLYDSFSESPMGSIFNLSNLPKQD